MMPMSRLEKAPQKFSPLPWSLFFSVLLNLFLVGGLLGLMPHPKHKSFTPLDISAQHGEYLLDWMTRYLSSEDASVLKAAFASKAADLKASRIEEHRAVTDLSTIFRQDPPDEAKLKIALEQVEHAKEEADAAVSDIIAAAYSKLSTEGRRRLAELSHDAQ